eukprot:148799_1
MKAAVTHAEEAMDPFAFEGSPAKLATHTGRKMVFAKKNPESMCGNSSPLPLAISSSPNRSSSSQITMSTASKQSFPVASDPKKDIISAGGPPKLSSHELQRTSSLDPENASKHRSRMDELDYLLGGASSDQPVRVRRATAVALAQFVKVRENCITARTHGGIRPVLRATVELYEHADGDEVIMLMIAVTLYFLARDPANVLFFDAACMRVLIDMLSRVSVRVRTLSSGKSDASKSRRRRRITQKAINIDFDKLFAGEGRTILRQSQDVSVSYLATLSFVSGAGSPNLKTLLDNEDVMAKVLAFLEDDFREFSKDSADYDLNSSCSSEREFRLKKLLSVMEKVTADPKNPFSYASLLLSCCVGFIRRLIEYFRAALLPPTNEVGSGDSPSSLNHASRARTESLSEATESGMDPVVSPRTDKEEEEEELTPEFDGRRFSEANDVLCSVLRVILNLTNNPKTGVSEDGVRSSFELFHLFHETKSSPKSLDFSVSTLSLGLIINLVEHSIANRKLFTSFNTPNSPTRSSFSAVTYLAERFLEAKEVGDQSESEETIMESNITASYLVMAMGCLMCECPENRELILASLPSRSLHPLSLTLRKFAAFQSRTNTLTRAALVSIVKVLRVIQGAEVEIRRAQLVRSDAGNEEALDGVEQNAPHSSSDPPSCFNSSIPELSSGSSAHID